MTERQPSALMASTIATSFDTQFVSTYRSAEPKLRRLYENAKQLQWNGQTDLPWGTQVDPQSISASVPIMLNDFAPYRQLDSVARARLQHAQIGYQISQFLHGEQGAMVVAAQLVSALPTLEGKLYASTQVMDEARHVEVFRRYLHEKIELDFPIDDTLKNLLNAIIGESRWDFKYIGMQVIIEGLAMAAFGTLAARCQDTLLVSLLHNVMRDEGRHIAFGAISLDGYYREMSQSELADREEFVIFACRSMQDRFVGADIAAITEWNRAELREFILTTEIGQVFPQMLFSRIVPNLKRLGLITPTVRKAFEQMEIIAHEHAPFEHAALNDDKQ